MVCKSELKRRSYSHLKTTASSYAKFRSPKPISQLRNEIHLRNFASKLNSEDVSSEDEWLGSLSLGVKKAGYTSWARIKWRRCRGPLRGHESADTPIGNESHGVVAGDEFLFLLFCLVFSVFNSQIASFACHIEYEIVEEAMNFMSYVAEVSRGWDEPNARNMGRMKSQPNAKGEMYILNDDIDMKAKIAAMARRLDELEMKKMQEVQAMSQTPLQAMPCAICLSYEHLVDECPTIPAVREMFDDCNTYNSNWRDHPNFSWKP
uniref:Uncharacterized protein n=1 Tax=Vitis vinifera TaxID=29760 RepID=A5B5C3_VITVI|nr:hypothetical protein VITISV_007124 [Vitis vinifera]